MAVKIRLRRTGARNAPSYRVVATDTRFPRDGRFLEIVGWYDPKREGPNFQLKQERIEHWLSNGARMSDTVKSLLKKARAGLGAPVETQKKPNAEPKSPEPAEEQQPAAEAAPAAESAAPADGAESEKGDEAAAEG